MDTRESGDEYGPSDGPTWSTTPADALIPLICDDERHLEIGRSVPDGAGHITVRAGEWAYCTAARAEEPHTWTEVSARPLSAVRHEDPLGAAGPG
jgi:hypothetical protein